MGLREKGQEREGGRVVAESEKSIQLFRPIQNLAITTQNDADIFIDLTHQRDASGKSNILPLNSDSCAEERKLAETVSRFRSTIQQAHHFIKV